MKVVSPPRSVLGLSRGWFAALAVAVALCLPDSGTLVAQTQPDPTQSVPYTPYQPTPYQPTPPSGRTLPSGVITGQTTTTGAVEPSDRRNTDLAGRLAEQRLRLANAAPEPPTEFQQLVFDSTGTQLPIFGASIFKDVPSTFAPVEDIPVAPDYAVGPGDELRVQIYGQVNQQGAFLVDRTGNIQYPDVGTIHVAGVRYQQLAAFLKGQLGRVYRNFDLNVNLGQLRSIQVFVVGSARRPGSYTISSLSTLLNALFASGGPLPQGSLRDIQVLRNGSNIVHFDLYDLLLHGDKTKDVPLVAGDVIFIPPVGAQAAVAGSVNTPAIYEIRPGTTAKRLIQLAGGETSVAQGGRIRVERIFEHATRIIEDIDLASDKDSVVEGGDIVKVEAIVDRYQDAVTLRGNVTTPGRYVWRPGLRIADVVTNKDKLITREYYRRRNALGVQPPYQNPANPNLPGPRPYRRNPYAPDLNNPSFPYPNSPYPSPSSPNALDSNSTYANAPNGNLEGQAPGYVNLANPNAPYFSNAPGALQASGTSDSRQADSAAQNGSGGNSRGTGGSVGSALTGSNGLFAPRNDVVLSAPDLDWSYAVIDRLNRDTLRTSLIPFNPGRLFLQGDQSQNLELQPGDVVTFFSTADLKVPTSLQTRFVRLEGEFVASGIYSVEPGETLRHLLTRAGGFTPDAYLYGSEFTRQSTRRVQQQRLNEYADNLEAQISARTATVSARAISDRDTAAAAASAVDAREAVARLRRSVPLGRIVLELKPDSRGLDSVPDLPLEDGDRFVVPRVPSTVAVEGQVYSANAFVFVRNRRENDYLRQAGGPDREADRKRAFILRADGSVYSNQYGNVSHATMFPGDTIVVPPQLDRRAILKDLIDISNIIGSFGIGAAAVNILR